MSKRERSWGVGGALILANNAHKKCALFIAAGLQEVHLTQNTSPTSPAQNIRYVGRGRTNVETLWTDANKQMQLLCDSLNVTTIKLFVTEKNTLNLSVWRIEKWHFSDVCMTRRTFGGFFWMAFVRFFSDLVAKVSR